MATKQEREDLQKLADDQAADLAALAEADRKNRAPRTAGQAGISGAFFVVFDYIVRGYMGVDLAPSDPASEAMPVIVTAAFITLGTWAVSVFMNRKPGSSSFGLLTKSWDE